MWTDEMIARLRKDWNRGFSTAKIGRRLGMSKNAVVGKAHRLGLPARVPPANSRPKRDKCGKGHVMAGHNLVWEGRMRRCRECQRLRRTKLFAEALAA